MVRKPKQVKNQSVRCMDSTASVLSPYSYINNRDFLHRGRLGFKTILYLRVFSVGSKVFAHGTLTLCSPYNEFQKPHIYGFKNLRLKVFKTLNPTKFTSYPTIHSSLY